jgi:hypothetical protein
MRKRGGKDVGDVDGGGKGCGSKLGRFLAVSLTAAVSSCKIAVTQIYSGTSSWLPQ